MNYFYIITFFMYTLLYSFTYGMEVALLNILGVEKCSYDVDNVGLSDTVSYYTGILHKNDGTFYLELSDRLDKQNEQICSIDEQIKRFCLKQKDAENILLKTVDKNQNETVVAMAKIDNNKTEIFLHNCIENSIAIVGCKPTDKATLDIKLQLNTSYSDGSCYQVSERYSETNNDSATDNDSNTDSHSEADGHAMLLTKLFLLNATNPLHTQIQAAKKLVTRGPFFINICFNNKQEGLKVFLHDMTYKVIAIDEILLSDFSHLYDQIESSETQ